MNPADFEQDLAELLTLTVTNSLSVLSTYKIVYQTSKRGLSTVINNLVSLTVINMLSTEFSVDSTKAYGKNYMGLKNYEPVKMCFWSRVCLVLLF